jgi:hypothetical protein
MVKDVNLKTIIKKDGASLLKKMWSSRVVSYSKKNRKRAGTLKIEVLLSTTQPLPSEVFPQ